MIRWMLLAFALVFNSLAHAQGCNNRFVLFGDSLSDPGNDYFLTGLTQKAPFVPIPPDPYSIGGHHFSNGMTWAERVANAIDSPASGASAVLNRLNTNYAFGGARARVEGPHPEVDLTTQVGLFMGNFPDGCPNATYILWIGGFDLIDALMDPSNAPAIIQLAVESIATNIARLASQGGKKFRFIVFDAPDVSKAPLVPLDQRDAVAGAVQLFNGLLGLALKPLQDSGINITRFEEVNALINAIEADPAAFRLVNVTTPCLKFGVEANFMCAAQPQYLFWDGIHPTSAGHQILANFIKPEIFP